MRRQVALAAVVLGSLAALVSSAFGEQPPAPVVCWTRAAGWLLVLVGAAAVPSIVGGIIGSVRLDNDPRCEDFCGLGFVAAQGFASG